ncbi:hypothetical protein [Verrucomicrobium sp. BvORR034]|jgi:hypothetical protein|uniref:hypothetical protein n=1 Tax=Verrucomicrobium sp. BvORR034 TaxID=1396418 RepID=UPI002240F369|nr:hypothetical protein [Verrucomicrobium sp. BvORR034]
MPCLNNQNLPEEPYFALRSADDLLQAAYQSTPALCRYWHLHVPRWWIRIKHPELSPAIARLSPRDRLWPFVFNRSTLSMRRGYVVVRDGHPIDAIITEMS